MKQVLQSINGGALTVADVPPPIARPGYLVVANEYSLISAGTEKMVRQLASMSLLGKARERPDQVRRVLEKVRNEGIVTTFQQVRAKLDEPMPLGYSSAGVVVSCGAGVQEFKPGQRVATAGPHSEVVAMPRHLCAHVPDGVATEQAAFAVVGSIALHGVRLAKLELGETAFVVGLGLVGQLAVALLRAGGIRVIATDPDAGKCELALNLGATVSAPGLTAARVEELTGGLGADAVILAASTPSSEPALLASHAVRRRGRIVLVGVVGLELDRRPFYLKECEFIVSCSYGPGRYDPDYEERGRDYPAGYVRWTEQRNIEAVLQMMSAGQLDVRPLITHRFDVEKAGEAYALIEKGHERYLGVVLRYTDSVGSVQSRRLEIRPTKRRTGDIGYGVIGAGNFAKAILLPTLAKMSAFAPIVVGSSGGTSSGDVAKRFGFARAVSDEAEILNDPSIEAVFILTRHESHARLTAAALRAGKHVFVEKPLALSDAELDEVEETLRSLDTPRVLMVGFNRRFSPAAIAIREFFRDCAGPLVVNIRFNAGPIPLQHWTQDDVEGGGRLIGEACHAVDLATYLTGAPVVRVFAESVALPHGVSDDQCLITMRHGNGSISSIVYTSGGDKAFPKERVEVFGGGRVGVIDDFREVTTSTGGKPVRRRMAPDKGHAGCLRAFAAAVKGASPPSPEESLAVTRVTFRVLDALRLGTPQVP